MNKDILNQYLVCNQEMAATTNADQILLKLKLYLSTCLDGLGMIYFNTSGISDDLHLVAYINGQDSTVVSYESSIRQCGSVNHRSKNIAFDHSETENIEKNSGALLLKEIGQNSAAILKLFDNKNFNKNAALQAKAGNCLSSVIKKQSRLSCFSACIPAVEVDVKLDSQANVVPKKIWCLLICKNNKKNEVYLEEKGEMILVLINLVFSHIARIEALKKLKQENHWIQDELKQIAALQRQLLPEDNIKIKGVEIAANFRACEHAGGDYYDFLSLTEILEPASAPRDSDFWGTMIADSAGHGATAAVEISMFDAILRTMNHENSTMSDGPAGVFNYANQYLFTRIIRGTFITSFVAGYNPDLGQITYACAGHPPPILFRSSTRELIELDQSPGIPLGVVKDYTWENAVISFDPNDMLLMYTDGILEANNVGGEQFGLERLKQLITEDLSLSCKEILTKIESAVDDFQHGSIRKDDQTLVILKRL